MGLLAAVILGGCTYSQVTVASLAQQMHDVNQGSMHKVSVKLPSGPSAEYMANTLDSITCDVNMVEKLANGPRLMMRITDKEDNRVTYYFDTVYLEDSVLTGSTSRLEGFTTKVRLSSIEKIEFLESPLDIKYIRK